MSSNEVKVGALTLGGIGLLAGIITFLGAFSFSGSGYKLQISYPQVGADAGTCSKVCRRTGWHC